MMFTISPDELIKMLAATGFGPAQESHSQRVVYLQASRGRVAVGCNDSWAEADSVTWDDGQCRMEGAKLFAAVNRFRLEPAITVNVAYGSLRIRHSVVPVLGCCPWTPVSEAEQSDFATD